MKIINLLILLLGIFSVISAFVALYRNPMSIRNRILVGLSFVTGPLWGGSIVLFLQTEDIIIERVAANLIYTVAILGGLLTFFLTKFFSHKESFKWYERILLYIPSFFFFLKFGLLITLYYQLKIKHLNLITYISYGFYGFF